MDREDSTLSIVSETTSIEKKGSRVSKSKIGGLLERKRWTGTEKVVGGVLRDDNGQEGVGL